mmetsp:Transcript_59010/g.111156  ORF Transcript_59010/g.111156 Transcript_59010/m.111156 type:complete len:596 (-) Transcript_59010:35-1822(-)
MAEIASEAPNMEEFVETFLAGLKQIRETTHGPDGEFPVAEEEVEHYGTVQRYQCFQRGPNSVVRLTLPELYTDCFARYNDKEFLIFEETRLTFGATMEAAVALSRSIKKEFALERGARVAIAGRNYPEWVVCWLCVNGYLNGVSLPVNSWWQGDELRYGLEDSTSSLFMADLERVQRAPFLKELNIPGICFRAGSNQIPEGSWRYEDLVDAGRHLPPLQPQPVQQDDDAMLMYTSGTTSKPKGVLSTHRNIMTAVNQYRAWYEAQGPNVLLMASPFFHVNGSHVGILHALFRGSKLVSLYKWDATRALEVIQAEKVNTIIGVPTNTYDLVNHPDFDKYDTSSMGLVGGGGSAFAAPMIKRVKDKFKKANAQTGYGLTESNAITIAMNAAIFPARPTSCGLPAVHQEVCILSESNEKLPPGGVGEICLRGANIMKEYWGKPEKTAEVFHFDKEGQLWFRTGDLGTCDAQQFVYILDRAKDIIIRGGENISCAEVEDACYEHPSIAEVAAVGVPHETYGEAVAVVVVFKAGAAELTLEELKKHAATRLAGFKVPAEMFVWEDGSLPRGATGKMQKREIRERVKEIRTAQQERIPSKL